MSQTTLPSNDDSASNLIPAYGDEQVLPTCDKCGAKIDTHDALVCRKCGWYPSIGTFVEIDRAWDSDHEETAVEHSESLKMPSWGWTMIACVVAVVAESIAARFLTSDAVRTTWSVTQLFLGLAVAFTCHLVTFILFMREISDAGLLDIVLKPIKPWILRVHELPTYQWLCHAGISAVVAVIMSFLVIGGLPYEKLWDWGFEKPVKQNLMGAIMDQVKQGSSEEKPLEEAVQDFAGKAGVDDNGKKPSKPKVKPESAERKFDDCLIIGYRANSEGLAYILFLAGENYGKLQYVGQVTPQLSIKELRDLTQQLEANKSFDPFVKLQMDGVTWVKPKFTCRVSYARKGKKGGLYDVKLESFLGEIEGANTSVGEAAATDVPASVDKP
jgi:hypothetical protein